MSGRGESDGIRDQDGNWRPTNGFQYPPIFERPWRPLKIIAWIFKWDGFLIPRHAFYAGLAILTWFYLQPDLAVSTELSIRWIAPMFVRNLILMVAIYGFYHVTLYVMKLQGTDGKYHPAWQKRGVKRFLFSDQVRDNMFYSLASGLPIWTAWEVLYIWMAANGRVPMITFASQPVWFIAGFLLVPIWRDIHFYCIHRLLHWKPLLRAIHSVHHRNPNPAPWSGMSMHPVEHLLYLSSIAIHFFVPLHPIHMFFNAQITALIPATVHAGFEGPYFGILPGGDFFHYLHHKHVNCNFGGHVLPLDKWFGRFYAGVGDYRSNVLPKRLRANPPATEGQK